MAVTMTGEDDAQLVISGDTQVGKSVLCSHLITPVRKIKGHDGSVTDSVSMDSKSAAKRPATPGPPVERSFLGCLLQHRLCYYQMPCNLQYHHQIPARLQFVPSGVAGMLSLRSTATFLHQMGFPVSAYMAMISPLLLWPINYLLRSLAKVTVRD